MINSPAAPAVAFSPSPSRRNLDLQPVNLRFLQANLTKKTLAIALPHLVSAFLIKDKYIGEEKWESEKQREICHHLVLDECSLTGKNCKGLSKCFKIAEKKLDKIFEIINKDENFYTEPDFTTEIAIIIESEEIEMIGEIKWK